MDIVYKLLATLTVVGFIGTTASVLIDTSMDYTRNGRRFVHGFLGAFFLGVIGFAIVGLALLWLG